MGQAGRVCRAPCAAHPRPTIRARDPRTARTARGRREGKAPAPLHSAYCVALPVLSIALPNPPKATHGHSCDEHAHTHARARVRVSAPRAFASRAEEWDGTYVVRTRGSTEAAGKKGAQTGRFRESWYKGAAGRRGYLGRQWGRWGNKKGRPGFVTRKPGGKPARIHTYADCLQTCNVYTTCALIH